jgi:hypothetical protein
MVNIFQASAAGPPKRVADDWGVGKRQRPATRAAFVLENGRTEHTFVRPSHHQLEGCEGEGGGKIQHG